MWGQSPDRLGLSVSLFKQSCMHLGGTFVLGVGMRGAVHTGKMRRIEPRTSEMTPPLAEFNTCTTFDEHLYKNTGQNRSVSQIYIHILLIETGSLISLWRTITKILSHSLTRSTPRPATMIRRHGSRSKRQRGVCSTGCKLPGSEPGR